VREQLHGALLLAGAKLQEDRKFHHTRSQMWPLERSKALQSSQKMTV